MPPRAGLLAGLHPRGLLGPPLRRGLRVDPRHGRLVAFLRLGRGLLGVGYRDHSRVEASRLQLARGCLGLGRLLGVRLGPLAPCRVGYC